MLSHPIFLIWYHCPIKKIFRETPNICVALNGLFADMRMSSSMYEVFNWNSSPDPPLTPAKHKRASLSLPPTTDIFAVDDKSDSDTRRPMIQRVASGESWSLRSLQESRERSVLFVSRMNIVEPLPLVLFSTRSRRALSLSLVFSTSLRLSFYFTTHSIDACHIHLTP